MFTISTKFVFRSLLACTFFSGFSLADTAPDFEGTWERCSLHYSMHSQGNPDVHIYRLDSWTFFNTSNANWEAKFFAKDAKCSQKITINEAQVLSNGDVRDLEPKASQEIQIRISSSPVNGALNLDLVSAKLPQYNTYLLAKLGRNSIELADRCFSQEYIDEGLCTKIDGDSPENRSTVFRMFPNDVQVFRKVR